MRPIKILPLGVSGSGKSVYLAALYERLGIQRSDACFTVRADAALAGLLSAVYRSVKDPSKPWPPGTMGSQYREYAFQCVVDTPRQEFCLLELLYLDFPGGILTGETDDSRFYERFKESDAFLILLDGVKIYHALAGDSTALDALSDDISTILKPLQQHVRKPIHMVVTKWDVLQRDHNLGQVLALLLSIDSFKFAVEIRQRLGRGTRLIPVSAVGPKFATLLPTGEMKKNEHARAEPFNVDLPISCLLFDLVNEAKSNIKESRDRTFWVRLWYGVLGSGSFFSALTRSVVDFVPFPPGIGFIKKLLQFAAEEFISSAESSRQQLRETYGSAILEASTLEQAFSELLKYQALEVYWMTREYPASILSKYNGS